MAKIDSYIKGVNVDELTKIIETMHSISAEAKGLLADNQLNEVVISSSGPAASEWENAFTEFADCSESFATLAETTGKFLQDVLDVYQGADNAMSRAIENA